MYNLKWFLHVCKLITTGEDYFGQSLSED